VAVSTKLRPILPILITASLMLSVGMGLRQSLGMFMSPITKDLGISVSQFTLAIAVQNLAWGFLQPLTGAWAARLGFRPLMVGGALLYVCGLVLLATSHSAVAVILGAGVCIGASMACCGSSIVLAVSARVVSAAARSAVFGIVSAAGSLGTLFAAPIGQALTQAHGWRVGLAGFVVLALVMVPAAWYAGRVDQVPAPVSPRGVQTSARAVIGTAMRDSRFIVLALAYFVCGMQLIFLMTHLPTYWEICGMDPMLSAQALGMIGGFNVLGSLFFGWAGGRCNKLLLVGGIYIVRSLVLVWYFVSAPTPESTLLFAGIMGFLWLGISPLVAGWIGEAFGVRWQAMLTGFAFMSHQFGSFVGAFGGGLIYDQFGSYTAAWQGGVALGLVAGIAQVTFALVRPPKPPLVAAT
jgi:predicted MFS family arabinose efflux permease